MARRLAQLVFASIALVASPPIVAQTVTAREIAAQHVESYSLAYQVPVELVEAVIEVESNWSPHAVSPKGAVGLMQLMPATAARFGVRNRFDIQENIRGGVAYLAWLIRLFRGDLRLALAAYFVGESRILLRGLAYSSPEVFQYVSRAAKRYRAKRVETLARQGRGYRHRSEMR
ncbi:MAG: lytic transglycosylase domain-containing protein [Acidobacteria bacterium]|nr:lytic transglycosylase domain-containing protein [Acidobacteriota bacterium]